MQSISGVFTRIDQQYLFQARQMQALSFAVHIPLVCFGIAFPAMVLFAEWRYLRTGDPLFRTLARRWSKVMLALFAIGVVTGTILSFEFGLLWPGFMAAFGNVFGLGFMLEGFSFVAAVGIILRGASYALRGQLDGAPRRRLIEGVFTLSSVLTPFALGTVVGAIASGRVPVGNAQGDLFASWLNPTSVLTGALAVSTSSYLAAVYLAADARRVGERTLELDFRARAL